MPHLRTLGDVEDQRGRNRAALWQQQEITTATGRHRGRWELSGAEALELAEASHGLLREVAKATRRELVRDAGTLRQKDPLGVQTPHRVSRSSPVYQALTAAMTTAPPAPALPGWAPLSSRRDLAGTLDQTPTGRRPSPYLRGQGARGHGQRAPGRGGLER